MSQESVITFPLFERRNGLVCAFSTRFGGYSTGEYAGLNLGRNTGDRAETVTKNRDYFFRQIAVRAEEVACGEQIHSARVACVDRPGTFLKTDALITRQKNLFLAVVTADCFPLFLFDPVSETVGVVHAGWRGVQAGIIENVFQILAGTLQINPGRLLAAIGPGLQAECFEIGEDVFRLFARSYLYPHPRADKRFLNLRQLILDKLREQGVAPAHLEASSECTHCLGDRYYSYRRQAKNSGRMMGIIGIR
jgi:polyphenol oxidase